MKRVYFLMILFLGSILVHAQDVIQNDRDALMALYNATNGDNWTNKTNWGTAELVSTWHGIKVTGNRITEINLMNNNLEGTIPAAIGNLDAVLIIELRTNKLHGTIPHEINNLSALVSLSINGNQLTGEIPVEIGQCTSLFTINLRDNQFNGTIPSTIGNLKNLQILDLTNNQLEGTIPLILKDLTKLIGIWLYGNKLFGPLPDFSKLTLTYLYLFGNYFTFEAIEPVKAYSIPYCGYVSQLSFPVINKKISGKLGTNVNIDITALSTYNLGGSNNRYQWFKNGVAASVVSSSPILSLSGVKDGDYGTYTCEVTNTIVTDLTLFSEDIELENPEVIQSDRDALMALYNATNGTNWTNNTNWGTTELVSTWHGVTVAGNRVTGISLIDNNLIGTIPAAIGNLDALIIIELRTNKLSGSIPKEIKNLSTLISLSINGNQLTGEIPAEIGQCTSLYMINLRDNQLSGTIPSTIGNLKNLQAFDLTNNQLEGNIPSVLKDLTGLTYIWLYGNKLSGPLPDLSKLTSLTYLYVFGNYFTFEAIEAGKAYSIPTYGYVGQLAFPLINKKISGKLGTNVNIDITALSTYNLGGSNNRYQWFKNGVAASVVSSSPILSLSGVKDSDYGTYTCEVTNTVVTDLTLFSETIELENPEVIQSDRDALMALYNATNGANWTNKTNWGTTELVSTWYGVMVTGNRVTRIDLNNNNLNGTIPVEFCNLSPLTYLDLHKNKLSGTIPKEIGKFTSLTYLALNSNQLSGSIPIEIGSLASLESLSLNVNQLSGSIPKEIGNLPNLSNIYLYNNQLTGTIPVELKNLNRLNIINFSNNQLSGQIPAELGERKTLTALGLSNNQLSGTIPIEIGNLTELRMLVLSGNQLEGSIPSGIKDFAYLTDLWLNNNKLSGALPSLSGLTVLATMHLEKNHLTFEAVEAAFGYSITNKNYSPQDTFLLNNKKFSRILGSNLEIDISNLSIHNLGGSNNRYQWFKNGVAITEVSSSPVMNLTGITDNDFGGYICKVTNTVVTDLTLISEEIAIEKLSPQDVNNLEIEGLKVFPNPSSGIFSIEKNSNQKISIKISNTEGKIIIAKDLKDPETIINMENSSKGLYFILFEKQGKTIVSKIVLK